MGTRVFKTLPIRTKERLAEISWFDDLCGGDTEYLSVKQPERASTYEHCRDIMITADSLGYSNILLPNSYLPGPDPLVFAAAMAPQTKNINMLVALRMGEVYPPTLAKSIASLDHVLKGRLNINIISSDLPGKIESSEVRYERTGEVIDILRQAWTRDRIQFDGKYYQIDLPSEPVKSYQQNRGPLFYFGGISNQAKDVCAKYCDVFLMWPEPEQNIYETMKDVSMRAQKQGRVIDFGLRVHVIVRETEAEAKAAAKKLMSKFDPVIGEQIKNSAQDSRSLGVFRQDQIRKKADEEGYTEPFLWSEIGKARSGCGSAIVGSPEQILYKINRYMDMGIRAFIFSGYPLIEEARLFSKLVLPHLPNVKFTDVYGKQPEVHSTLHK